MHFNIAAVHHRKTCCLHGSCRAWCVWMLWMFFRSGLLVRSLFALVFLSPESRDNFPPSRPSSQRLSSTCIPSKAWSNFSLGNPELKAGPGIGLCFLLVCSSGFSPSWAVGDVQGKCPFCWLQEEGGKELDGGPWSLSCQSCHNSGFMGHLQA